MRPIQEFVNAAFAPEIPGYLALEGGREPLPKQPSVLALPIPEPYGKRNIAKGAINKSSPATVAAFIAWMVNQSDWKIIDSKSNELRKVESKDVCILFRRFTNDGKDLTQDYVRCLEAQGLPHVLVGSKSFHHREEIASIRTALRAIEWPDDELSVYATIRNFWGVLDGTLFQFKNKYGALYPFKRFPKELESDFLPIQDALQKLAALHKTRNERPIADTIQLLLDHVRALTAFALRKGGRRVVANVQRLIESARSFELRQATSFRSFVLYLEEQAERGEASDAPILEQDTDGVKIMTVHKAKGLEFPVVILADLTAHLTGQGDRYVDPARKLCAQRLLRCAPWDLLENLAQRRNSRSPGGRASRIRCRDTSARSAGCLWRRRSIVCRTAPAVQGKLVVTAIPGAISATRRLEVSTAKRSRQDRSAECSARMRGRFVSHSRSAHRFVRRLPSLVVRSRPPRPQGIGRFRFRRYRHPRRRSAGRVRPLRSMARSASDPASKPPPNLRFVLRSPANRRPRRAK